MRILYGVAMSQGIATSDLSELQRLESEAEAHLKQYGDIPTLLAILKVEIAKLEAGQKY